MPSGFTTPPPEGTGPQAIQRSELLLRKVTVQQESRKIKNGNRATSVGAAARRQLRQEGSVLEGGTGRTERYTAEQLLQLQHAPEYAGFREELQNAAMPRERKTAAAEQPQPSAGVASLTGRLGSDWRQTGASVEEKRNARLHEQEQEREREQDAQAAEGEAQAAEADEATEVDLLVVEDDDELEHARGANQGANQSEGEGEGEGEGGGEGDGDGEGVATGATPSQQIFAVR